MKNLPAWFPAFKLQLKDLPIRKGERDKVHHKATEVSKLFVIETKLEEGDWFPAALPNGQWYFLVEAERDQLFDALNSTK